MFRFLGIFDIVSSDLRLILSKQSSIYRSILSSCSYCWGISTTGASYFTMGAQCNGESTLSIVALAIFVDTFPSWYDYIIFLRLKVLWRWTHHISYLSTLVHHLTFSACKSTPKSAQIRKKLDQIGQSFALSLQKRTSSCKSTSTPVVTNISYGWTTSISEPLWPCQ